MSQENISVLRAGIVLEGDEGASKHAMVLANKQADNYTDVILCYASNSPHHPFVVWSYENATGACRRGDYFDNIIDAVRVYEDREW